ncbi:lysozyme [Citrobacter cronae]|uniref:lysozyme n=1 Tax=Citrobacter cronae TaxID=1748967 RepID=UPI0021D1BE01|nr:lysozyme [Citrobacter cronae]MCU6199103.1 lysozyme [Citrobacter cronae]
MKTSENGKGFTKKHESCKLSAYKDGGGVPTIGWGHTRGVKMGQTITAEQAEALFDADLEPVETCINEHVIVPLTQNQFDALSDFVFNVGIDAFARSTLLTKLNAGNYRAAADQLTRWVYDNSVFIKGLYNRRCDERDLFLS